MTAVEATLEATLGLTVPLHLIARMPEGNAGPFPVLVGLHGYAMTAAEMMGFLLRLAPEGFLVVSLEGPHSTFVPGTEETARKIGFHWGVSPRVEEVRAGHRAAVTEAISWAVARGGDRARVSLAAFSQPVSHDYRLALAPPGGVPFRVVVGLCGGLPGEWAHEPSPAAVAGSTAAFHASASHDPYYPEERIAHFPEALAARFLRSTYRVYEGGHRIPSAALDDARELLVREG